MKSIKHHLHLGLAISLVISMALFAAILDVVLTKLGEEFVVARLMHDGESLLEALRVDPADHRLQVRASRLGAIYQRALSGHYWVVLGPGGQRLRSRSLWDEALPVRPLAQGETDSGYWDGPLGQRLLVWSGGFGKQGVGLTLAVAEDLSPLLRNYRRLGWVFAGLSLTLLLVLLLVQGRLVTLGFRPVERARRELRQLQQGELQTLSTNVPEELRPLVAEVNYLLALFTERLRRSRNAVGNLAHALKAPLGVLRGLSLHPGCRSEPDTAVELHRQTERIHHLLERELKRARLAGKGVPGQWFDPRRELPTLVELLEKIHGARKVCFDCKAPSGISYRFDRDDMLELLGNLLDNAGKWADEQVRCRFRGEPQRLSLTVEDDGPGCSAETLRQLTERGVRIDEGVPGHGLGLAIVQDIVAHYHGKLEFGSSPELGGLRVDVDLVATNEA